MKRYLAYLRYVVRHRRFVLRECWRRHLIWRGLVHDLSKFLPGEFAPYARYFYERNGSKREVRDKTGYYKPTDTGDAAFDFAWLLHQKRNRHHWQWWVLPLDDGGTKCMPMDEVSIIEMLCDWIGAGKAQGYISPPEHPLQEAQRWYEKNKTNMQLEVGTRLRIEAMLRGSPDGY